VVIDIQGKLVTMVHEPERTIAATNRLMRIAGLFGRPVILTEQYPEGLGPTHPDVRAVYDALETPKRHVSKLAFGCCGEPAFARALDDVLPGVAPERRQIVVAGIEAHVCVKQTVIELLDAGSDVHVCWEAVSARGEEYYRHALEELRHAGARITNHESVGFEWARSKEHASFKGLSKLLREGQIT
jgi:nicotinamidase-related amidase